MPEKHLIDPDKRARVAALHAQGLGRNEIARRLDMRPADVTRAAREAGLSFDRAATDKATRARTRDMAAARQTQLIRAYDAVDMILDRLEDPHPVAMLRGEGGIPRETPVSQIPARDLAQLTDALYKVRTVASKLEAVDNPAAVEASDMLTRLADRLGIDDTAEPTQAHTDR